MSEQKHHWKKTVSDPNFIGEGDFQEGEEKVATIKTVKVQEAVATAEGKSKKDVLYFQEPLKPMIMNVSRGKSIEKVAGSGFYEDWPGVKIQLYIEHGIKAFGEVVSAVRVRPFKPRIQPQEPVPACADCGGEITPAYGKNARKLSEYTKSHYGVPLCADCATKRKSAVEQPHPEPEETPPETGIPTANPETGEVL